MQVNQFLERSAQKFPNKKAVWYRNTWMTYAELDAATLRLANFLIDKGIGPGDRVALLFENSFDYIIGYYAVLKCGAVTVALNTETSVDSLIYLLNDSGAKVIISQKKFSKYLVPALVKVPYLTHVITDQEDLSVYNEIGHCNQTTLQEIYKNGKDKVISARTIDIDLASLVYTSGSTGKPKGVTLTHLNIVSNTRSIVNYLHLTENDRIMVVLPFYYIYGKSLLNTHFYSNGSVVIDNRFAFPNVILQTMQKTDITGFSGVPSTFMILLNKSVVKKQNFPSLRYVTQAGGAMAPAIQKEVVNAFKPAKLYVMYGATEASARLSYLEPEDLTRKWGSIGKAIPNVELAIADDQGNRQPAGVEGHIVARGSNMMQGYWNDPKETEKVLRNGWYYTGDIGKKDEEGFFYVVGRTKDMIKVGGERVSSKEVEEAILELKQVHEVAVIGIADEYLGEAIKAFIVLSEKNSINKEIVIKHCQKKLPGYKIPKHIEFIDSLPKNKSGKVMKSELKP
jgi:acyl-CoA synthetase (AMP-forming)/AMP-acid ligase II